MVDLCCAFKVPIVHDQAPELPEALVLRNEVTVMFKRVADDPAAISRGWSELEEALGSLRGRKFYGAFDATIREYRRASPHDAASYLFQTRPIARVT